MYYISLDKLPDAPYEAPCTFAAPTAAVFPDSFMPEFYKEGKLVHGFVKLTVDNGVVTSCTWDEEAYQAYISMLAIPPKPPTPQPTTDERVEALERENKTLQAQLKAMIQSNQMLEDCLVEMAGSVYA